MDKTLNFLTKCIIVMVRLLPVIAFPFVADYIVNKILNLSLDWTFDFFFLLSCIYAISVINHTFLFGVVDPAINRVEKFKLFIAMTIFFVIAFYPTSQDIRSTWIGVIFMLLGAASGIFFFVVTKDVMVKPVDRKRKN